MPERTTTHRVAATLRFLRWYWEPSAARRLPAHLPAMPQESIRQHAGDHRFADRHGANADARVMAALGDDLRLLAGAVIVRRGARIDDVGLTAKRATTGCPLEMPPRTPPA